jgi:hypothetical protein
MAFFPAALRRRVRISRSREEFLRSLPKGEVQKLVLDGPWRDRRWNDRWLEVTASEGVNIGNELLYAKNRGGNVIGRIAAHHISEVQIVSMQSDDSKLSEECLQDDREPSRPSLLSTVMRNCEDFREMQNCFLIITDPLGNGRGKEYLFKTRSKSEAEGWVQIIDNMKQSVQPLPSTAYAMFRKRIRAAYKSNVFQIFVALMIYLNLMTNVVSAQTNPDPGSEQDIILSNIDIFLTSFFTFELALNVYTANTFISEFVPDYWNWYLSFCCPTIPRN